MKVLKGTDAVIKGRFYKEGQSIPKENEKDFSKYLIEIDSPASKDDAAPNTNLKKKKNKR